MLGESLDERIWAATAAVESNRTRRNAPADDMPSLESGYLAALERDAPEPVARHEPVDVVAPRSRPAPRHEPPVMIEASPESGWPEPQALPSGLLPVEPFDDAMLPESLRGWVADIADRAQCPPDYVAASAMAALGSVIGRKVAIRPKARDNWTVTANQWALVVGRPGAMKSPAIEEALKPVKRLAARALDEFKAVEADYRARAKAEKLRGEEFEKRARKALATDPGADVSHLLRETDDQAPMLRRYIAVDSNAASLGELHRQNPNGLLVHQDEIVSLLRSLDRDDQAEARGFYLTGWNGDSAYTFDRIGRGLNLHIPGVCLSLLGGTQPGRLAEYVRHAVGGGTSDDGLVQRFGMLVWPDASGEWRNVDRWPDTAAKSSAFGVFDRLDAMTAEDVGATQDVYAETGAPEGLPYVRFDPAGAGLFLEWRSDLERRLRSGDMHPAVESHLAKYRKLVPGLALIDALASGATGAVGERSVTRALAWAEYLETHARRAYGAVTSGSVETARAILYRIKKGDLPERFQSRDVWRPCWTGLTDAGAVGEALGLLTELDWLAVTVAPTAGRPRTTYTVNPRARHG